MQVYRTPILTLDPDAKAGGGLVEVVKLSDAQATVEALQRERDEWRSNAVAQEARANDLERDCKDLLSDIDGERAKVGDLLKKIAYWEKRHSTYRELAEENMNLKSDELSALQALVRALQRERDTLREATKVICGHCCEPMAIPSKAVLQTQLTQLKALVRAKEDAYEKILLSRERLEREMRGYPPVDNEGIPMVWQEPVGWVKRHPGRHDASNY